MAARGHVSFHDLCRPASSRRAAPAPDAAAPARAAACCGSPPPLRARYAERQTAARAALRRGRDGSAASASRRSRSATGAGETATARRSRPQRPPSGNRHRPSTDGKRTTARPPAAAASRRFDAASSSLSVWRGHAEPRVCGPAGSPAEVEPMRTVIGHRGSGNGTRLIGTIRTENPPRLATMPAGRERPPHPQRPSTGSHCLTRVSASSPE